jgi:hypothetical protein
VWMQECEPLELVVVNLVDSSCLAIEYHEIKSFLDLSAISSRRWVPRRHMQGDGCVAGTILVPHSRRFSLLCSCGGMWCECIGP